MRFRLRWLRSSRRVYFKVLVSAIFLYALVRITRGPATPASSQKQAASLSFPPSAASKRTLHVAVEERTTFHNEVWPAFIFSLVELPSIATSLYLNGSLRRQGMTRLAKTFFQSYPRPWSSLLPALAISDPERRIDVLVSITCDKTLGEHGKQLLKIQRARETPFKLICVIHHADEVSLQRLYRKLIPWYRHTDIELVALSDHIVKSASDSIFKLSTAWWPLGVSALHQLRVTAFTPVFTIPQSLTEKPPQSLIRVSNAIIQGKITSKRRDYASVLKSLAEHLERDAEHWGYRFQAASGKYEFAEEAPYPFKLWIIGQYEPGEDFQVPHPLTNVVSVVDNLSYEDYYAGMYDADIVLPAFSSDTYYTHSASSSIAAAMITRTPVLADARLLAAYTYLNEKNAVYCPEGVDAIEAISRLRRHNSTLQGHSAVRLANPAAYSWPKDQILGAEVLEEIYAKNDETLELLLSNHRLHTGPPL